VNRIAKLGLVTQPS